DVRVREHALDASRVPLDGGRKKLRVLEPVSLVELAVNLKQARNVAYRCRTNDHRRLCHAFHTATAGSLSDQRTGVRPPAPEGAKRPISPSAATPCWADALDAQPTRGGRQGSSEQWSHQ